MITVEMGDENLCDFGYGEALCFLELVLRAFTDIEEERGGGGEDDGEG